MRTRVFVKGQRNSKVDLVIEKLKPILSDLDSTFDAQIKSALKNSDIHLEELGNYGKYIFCTINSIGVSICSGHIDGLYSKLFNAYSYYKSGDIEALILIAKTRKETWWEHQEVKIRKNEPLEPNSDGNRQTWGDVKEGISSSSHWYDLPITALVIERKLSAEKHDKYEW